MAEACALVPLVSAAAQLCLGDQSLTSALHDPASPCQEAPHLTARDILEVGLQSWYTQPAWRWWHKCSNTDPAASRGTWGLYAVGGSVCEASRSTQPQTPSLSWRSDLAGDWPGTGCHPPGNLALLPVRGLTHPWHRACEDQPVASVQGGARLRSLSSFGGLGLLRSAMTGGGE